MDNTNFQKSGNDLTDESYKAFVMMIIVGIAGGVLWHGIILPADNYGAGDGLWAQAVRPINSDRREVLKLNTEIQNIDTGNLNQDFQPIDNNLSGL